MTKTKKARKKPLRFLSWLARLERGTGIVAIKLQHSATRVELDRYFIAPVKSAPGGEGFRLERIDEAEDGSRQVGEVYHVLVGGDVEQGCCDCRGHEAHGHCKHHDACRLLVESGRM